MKARTLLRAVRAEDIGIACAEIEYLRSSVAHVLRLSTVVESHMGGTQEELRNELASSANPLIHSFVLQQLLRDPLWSSFENDASGYLVRTSFRRPVVRTNELRHVELFFRVRDELVVRGRSPQSSAVRAVRKDNPMGPAGRKHSVAHTSEGRFGILRRRTCERTNDIHVG